MKHLFDGGGMSECGWELFNRAYDAFELFVDEGFGPNDTYEHIVSTCALVEKGELIESDDNKLIDDFVVNLYGEMKQHNIDLSDVTEIITHAASVASYNSVMESGSENA